ncbi:MAG TPA: cytochrome c oxidase subunit II [Polyangiaceae bacterium]|nr:cytochrome c oxidase subunit II [Polyangiaceae bacterium]
MITRALLDPRSPQARAIADLFDDTFILCGVIFAVVTGLIVYAVVRFRDRGGGAPPQIEGHTRLELAWTAVPFAVLVVLFALTARTMAASDPPPDREPDLVVVAHQWWWEVRYRSGAVTANEIHIPAGKALVVGIESADVVHDFWVPELARKIDATPGRRVSIWLQADAPGTYIGTCAEYCGAQHAWMRILVVAQPPEEFAVWEKHMLESAPSPHVDAAARGARLFEERTCVKCHAIAGNGETPAKAGPDLTHLAERQTLGAGVMKNTPGELARWLKHPQEVKEGSHMPDLQLTDAQVADFIAYFETLQ